ncbi:MAG: RimK family protein [Opitutales bacterium]|nr:RimK family protein [Opitutales bacterium]
MKPYLLVTDHPERWREILPGASLISASAYFTDSEYAGNKTARVINLCNSYRYQSKGYYVSLVAEARGHRPLPAIETVRDTRQPSIIRLLSSDIQDVIHKSFQNWKDDVFELRIYFSRTPEKAFEKLARQMYNLFPAPLLKTQFKKTEDGWTLVNVSMLSLTQVPSQERPFMKDAVERFVGGHGVSVRRKHFSRYSLAILYDPKDPAEKASDQKAIQNFVQAAEALSIDCELIGQDDYGKIAEFDALFIRETTGVNHYTYRFARKAEHENLVVIDDPKSILKCANKVFLAEILSRLKIPIPKTVLIDRENHAQAIEQLGFPIVLKKPDSSFSQGVKKAENLKQWETELAHMFESSDLVVAQQFIPTEFDWRIGVLNRKVLYACRYYMAPKHWQIYNRTSARNTRVGKSETVQLEEVPLIVLNTALKAANAIGDGLYGVDIKLVGSQCMVVEINDNPSIDSGVEDKVLKGRLYSAVMEEFFRRMELKATASSTPSGSGNGRARKNQALPIPGEIGEVGVS